MELGLSLGLGIAADNHRPEKSQNDSAASSSGDAAADEDDEIDDSDHATSSSGDSHRRRRLTQLDLLPPAPVQKIPAAAAAESSSPNSVASAFRAIDFSMFKRNRSNVVAAVDSGAGDCAAVNGGCVAASRVSDEDENGVNGRKKLRLTKEQSAYLEESFKEHHTLNPKQKHALAKQLNLRPRQVEVWFQNRRARTKLKQTEVDCEYLKRCCETLREENRRLHKELQDLRALKSSNPFYMNLPATTLTMCPSCEKVASTTTNSAAVAPPSSAVAPPSSAAADSAPKARPFLSKPRFFPFTAAHPHQSAAS